MNPNEQLEAWKRERSREPVPQGFADGVMRAVRRSRVGGRKRLAPALVCAAAGVAVLVRVTSVLALLLTE